MPELSSALELPPDVLAVVRQYRTCELTTISKAGQPVTWPLCARLLDDGRFLLTTSIGLPQKAFNVRRNPQVSLSFSEPTGSGLTGTGAVLVQGRATVTDTPLVDFDQDPEVRRYFVETIFARQPSGRLMSSWLGRWLMPWYYLRLLLHVTPERVHHWPDRRFDHEPQTWEIAHG